MAADEAAYNARPRPHGIPVLNWGGKPLTRPGALMPLVAMMRTRPDAGPTVTRLPVPPAVPGQPLPPGVNYDEGIMLMPCFAETSPP